MPSSRPHPPIYALAHHLVRFRGRWTVGAALSLGLALWLSSRLSLRHEARDFLPRGAEPPDSTAAAIEEALGGADRIVVVLEADHAMQPRQVGPVLDLLAARLAAIGGVRRVEHRLRPELQRFLEQEGPSRLALFLRPDELAGLAARLDRDAMARALTRVVI